MMRSKEDRGLESASWHLQSRGRIHTFVGTHFQLHNTGLGFCADCQADGDIPGCPMTLAPCSNNRQQQVGDDTPRDDFQSRKTSGWCLLGCPSVPFKVAPLCGPMSLDRPWFLTERTCHRYAHIILALDLDQHQRTEHLI